MVYYIHKNIRYTSFHLKRKVIFFSVNLAVTNNINHSVSSRDVKLVTKIFTLAPIDDTRLFTAGGARTLTTRVNICGGEGASIRKDSLR